MDNRAVIERIMRNLDFEVESNSHSEKIKERPNPSTPDPLNVKIKVRKKEMNEFYNRGFISNNQSEAQVVPQKVRIISSDETIMSFDMFMEADDKIISPKHRKLKLDRRKPGICLDTRTDEDNQPYMPESHGSPLSKLDEEIYTFRKSPERIERTFLGSKCKPGGCLDPPFDEDIYSYKPSETAHLQQQTDNSDIIDHREKSKSPDKNKRKSVEPFHDNAKKFGSIQNLTGMEPIKKSPIAHVPKESNGGKYRPVSETPLTRDSDPIDKISDRQDRSMNSKLNLNAKGKRKSKDTSFSISPVNNDTDFIKKPVINYSPGDTKKARTRVSNQEQSRQSINGSVNGFFMPPKGFKRDSDDQAKRDLSKQHFFNPQSVKNKSEEYLKIPALLEPFPITTPSDHVSAEQISLSKVTSEIKPNIEKNDKQPTERKLNSNKTENKSNKSLNSNQQNQELTDADINDTSSSILIGDIKKNAVPIYDKISYPNSDNINALVASNNIDDLISLSENSKTPVENTIQLEKDRDINHKTESNTYSEKKPNIFDKVESSEDQFSDTSKIMSRKDKNGIKIPKKDDEEQTIAIENEPKIQNQIHEDKQSSKIHEENNVSDSINQHLDVDNNLENMIVAKDIHPISGSEQKPKSGSNIIETLQKNADINKHHRDSNFTDDMTLEDRPLQISNTQDQEIFEQPHNVSIVSDSKSQPSDLDNMIPDKTTNEDIDRISVSEQKPELENDILKAFQENANLKVNIKNSNIVDMLGDENKTLDDETLQITKPVAEEIFEKQHVDSNITGSISQHFDLDNTIENNIVDRHSDENMTLEDKELLNMDIMAHKTYEKPQVAYSEGLSAPTVEQYHKVRDEEEPLANYIESPVKDFELPATQISAIKDHLSDFSTQKHIIKGTSVDTDKKDKRDEDEILSGIQTQDVTTIRLSDDSVITSDLKTISLNLAFHTYLKNRNETIFETILNENDISRYPNDSITVIRSQIKVSSKENLPELNIPIDPMYNICIKINSNDQDKKSNNIVSDKIITKPISIPNFSGSGKALDTIPESKIVKQSVRNQPDQNDTALHRTLTDIYEQELVPLQTMIRSLKNDIDYLTEQRTLLKTKVICSKKSFHRKKISYNNKCCI